MTETDPARGALTPPTRLLAILILVYVVSLVDRSIIGILATSIKADLALDDTQLGLLGGFAFVALYATVGVPVAWLADRRSRVAIISVSVAAWSICTSLCGLARNYAELFIARMGVGIGEAGGIAPSYSLIADHFPQHQRARALAIFTIGSAIGFAIGILAGGWIAANSDWRVAFVVTGLIGLPVAALVRFGIREPVRGGFDGIAAQAPPPAWRAIVSALARNRTFWLLTAGATLSNVSVNGLFFWLPSYFQRNLGLTLFETSWFYGTLVLVGGIAGMTIGGMLGDRLGRRSLRPFVLIPAISFLLSAPLYALALFTSNLWLAWFFFLLPQALAFFYPGPMLTALNHVVPPNMRATASAIFLMIAHLFGTGLGTAFIGIVSDAMAADMGSEGLRYALLLAVAANVLAAFAFAAAALTIKRDWRGRHPGDEEEAAAAAAGG